MWIQPVAGADQLLDARGTHAALEERFHSEVSLPKGYQIGDWEAGCLSVSSPGPKSYSSFLVLNVLNTIAIFPNV